MILNIGGKLIYGMKNVIKSFSIIRYIFYKKIIPENIYKIRSKEFKGENN